MKHLILYLFTFSLISCGGGPAPTAGTGDFSGYEVEKVSGTNVSKAIKKNSSNGIGEEGFILNGQKSGVWLTYHDDGRIATLSSYSDGMLNGPYLEFNTRGQIEKKVGYSANQFDGTTASYKFGRPEKESNYKNGKLDGPHTEYNSKGDKQKYVEFKNGKQHGKLRYFDDEGNITLEYEYKNGEKVSGGMTKKDK